MTDIRYNKETDRFERVEAFSEDDMKAQVNAWQGQIDNLNVEIQQLLVKKQELQDLIDGRDSLFQ